MLLFPLFFVSEYEVYDTAVRLINLVLFEINIYISYGVHAMPKCGCNGIAWDVNGRGYCRPRVTCKVEGEPCREGVGMLGDDIPEVVVGELDEAGVFLRCMVARQLE